jgi:hypothetical protein
MKVKAIDNQSDSVLLADPKVDHPYQKVILVSDPLKFAPGEQFDVTLHFEWQASKDQPNHFDGMNLMYFRHGVKHLKYHVRFPWKAKHTKVMAYGIKRLHLTPDKETYFQGIGGGHVYTFEIVEPRPLAYLIFFGPVQQWNCSHEHTGSASLC